MVALYHVVGDDEAAANGQAVHEIAVVGPRHVLGVDGPTAVVADNLSIVLRTGHARATPVLGIDEMGAFQGLALVVFHASVAHEFRVEFITLGMGDDQVHVGGVHPLGKRVGHRLRQSTAVGCPCVLPSRLLQESDSRTERPGGARRTLRELHHLMGGDRASSHGRRRFRQPHQASLSHQRPRANQRGGGGNRRGEEDGRHIHGLEGQAEMERRIQTLRRVGFEDPERRFRQQCRPQLHPSRRLPRGRPRCPAGGDEPPHEGAPASFPSVGEQTQHLRGGGGRWTDCPFHRCLSGGRIKKLIE